MFGMSPDMTTSKKKKPLVDYYAPNLGQVNIFGKAAPIWYLKLKKKQTRQKRSAFRTHWSKISDMRCHCGHVVPWL